MNKSRRKLILCFSIFLGAVVAATTGVLAYASHQMQLARFGDIFDRVGTESALGWVAPTLIVLVGISIIGVVFFIGLYIFFEAEARNEHEGDFNEQ
jgi:hypothetical protein